MRASYKALAPLVLALGNLWSASLHTDGTGSDVTTAAVRPEFRIELRRNTLRLSGHAVSRRHESRLRQTAATVFPGHDLRTDFRPLGVAPPWWDEATAALLEPLAGLQSPSAFLDKESLRIEALTAIDTVPDLQHLREVLPASIEPAVHIVETDPDIDPLAICARQFAAFDPGQVAFDESDDTMLSSAYPALDRVIVLADACREARIAITGHTDSSGSESWNRQLSLARARAVAGYLEERGIDAARIDTTGVGSSYPIADNATRYGRSINRRIDVRLQVAD